MCSICIAYKKCVRIRFFFLAIVFIYCFNIYFRGLCCTLRRILMLYKQPRFINIIRLTIYEIINATHMNFEFLFSLTRFRNNRNRLIKSYLNSVANSRRTLLFGVLTTAGHCQGFLPKLFPRVSTELKTKILKCSNPTSHHRFQIMFVLGHCLHVIGF